MSDRITRALTALGAPWRVRADGLRFWAIESPHAPGVAIHAGVSGDWLRFRRAGILEPSGAVDPWALLHRNASLSGGVRIVLDGGIGATDGKTPWLVGEVALDDLDLDDLDRSTPRNVAFDDLDGRTPFERRCREIVEGLTDAGQPMIVSDAARAVPPVSARASSSPGIAGATAFGPVSTPDLIDDLRECCRATGRPLTEGGDRKTLVELDTDDGPARAVVAATASRALRLRVELATGTPPGDECRTAIGHLLLAAAARVRLARPVARETVALEVRFDSRPTPAEIGHALAALAVAVGVTRSEVRLLHDPALAQRFLDTRSRHRPRALASAVSGPAT